MSFSINNLRRAGMAVVVALMACVGSVAMAQGVPSLQSVVGGPVKTKMVKPTVASQSPDASLVVASKPDFTQELATLTSPQIHAAFPRMKVADIEVLAPSTKKYNCIAHSLEVKYWVNPETGDDANPLAKMDGMYAKLGYVRQDGLNFAKENGVEKVVVYATLKNDGSIHNVTHAARQDTDGTWTSKLGALSLIRHRTPEVLRGPTYGAPVAVYVRKVHHS